MRAIAGLGCVALLLALAGCKGFFVPINPNPPPTNTGDYLYVGNGQNTYIAGFGVNSSGQLALTSGSPYNNSSAASSLAITPANKFLYVGTLLTGIFCYQINSDGSITLQNNGRAVANDLTAITAMQVDASGNYLLAAGVNPASQGQAIGIYQINSSTGALTRQQGSPLGLFTGPGAGGKFVQPTALLIAPGPPGATTFPVYVSLGTLGVQVLTLGPNGALSTGSTPTYLPPAAGSTTPSDQGLAADPSGVYLFVAENGTGLRVLSIGANGALKEISGSPFAVGTGPWAIAFDASGSYLYVANKGSSNISAFTYANSPFSLTPVAGSPFSSGGLNPIAIVADNSKKYLAVINSGNNTGANQNDLQLFSFSTTTPGALVAGSGATTGSDPTNPAAIAATQ